MYLMLGSFSGGFSDLLAEIMAPTKADTPPRGRLQVLELVDAPPPEKTGNNSEESSLSGVVLRLEIDLNNNRWICKKTIIGR